MSKATRLLMHCLTLAPIAHLFVGLPLFCVLFAGSISYCVGLILYLLALVVPIEFIQTLALSYTVTGKLLVGSTLYYGWPGHIISLVPALYLACLIVLKYTLSKTDFAHWILYNIDTAWRITLVSLCVILVLVAGGYGFEIGATYSAIITTFYLLVRVCRFYTPLLSNHLRKLTHINTPDT